MDLKLEDLVKQCQKCNGKGRYTETTGTPTGGVGVRYTTEQSCDACQGKGIQFTETGAVLKDFVQTLKQRHLI